MIEKALANRKKQEYLDKQIRMLNRKYPKGNSWSKGFVIPPTKSKEDIDMDAIESQRKLGCYDATCRLKKVRGF